MRGRLTDQAAVAVALARAAAGDRPATVAHLLAGLAAEGEGRAGVRLRERASAAATLTDRARAAPAPPLERAVRAASEAADPRAATTVDLLDAAVCVGGDDVADLIASAGYHRDLDAWVVGDAAEDWFEHAETYGFHPGGDAVFDAPASRVVAQVRAVGGGAVEVLIAAAAAPDADVLAVDPAALAAISARLERATSSTDAGLEAVISAATTLVEGNAVTVGDLVRAALVAGGDAPRLVLELADSSWAAENPPFP